MKPNTPVLLSVAACTLAGCSSSPKEVKRPNIIFMMTDDHTTQAMSCYGGKLIQTPHMDRIATEGIRFDNCYAVNALSGPSRACVLTGKFSHVNGFKDNASVFDGDQPTFPKLLREAGYQTALIGKWHLISEPQGFDYWSVLSGQHEQGDYYTPDFLENGKPVTEEGYVTDIITDKTIRFIENRDKNKPFCVMYHQKAPHRNWMPAPRHLGIFNNAVFPEPATLFDDYEGRGRAAKEQDMSIEHTLKEDWDLKLLTRDEMLKDTTNRLYQVYRRMPPEVQDKWDASYARRIEEYRKNNLTGKALTGWKYQQYMRDYLATVLAVDENIGRLLNYLEEIGELDNTFIVYTSDQGFFLGEHGWFDKRFMYEECQRMPVVMRYPRVIKAGSITEALSMNVDFAPTFLDLAGVKVPDDMQGTSLMPVLGNEGKIPTDWREAVYYHYYEYPAEHSVKRHYGIRTRDFKLMHFYNDIDEWEMYDMKADPNEMNNIYGKTEYGEKQSELMDLLRKTRHQYGDEDPCE
jgi:Arylsulfatase A and related enzymes